MIQVRLVTTRNHKQTIDLQCFSRARVRSSFIPPSKVRGSSTRPAPTMAFENSWKVKIIVLISYPHIEKKLNDIVAEFTCSVTSSASLGLSLEREFSFLMMGCLHKDTFENFTISSKKKTKTRPAEKILLGVYV